MKTGLQRLWSRPQAVLVLGFAAAIVLGSLALSLPCCQRGEVGFLDALFTAVSAVCVTGLVTLDTGADFTLGGQWTILVLIQLGGLGIMTFSALLGTALGRRLSIRDQYILQDVILPADDATTMRTALLSTLAMTVILEAAGTLALLPALDGELFTALFHAVSAFCNAGFSLWSENLTAYRADPWVTTVIMTLIVAGGLGQVVLFELARRLTLQARGRRVGRLGLHTRVVLRSTLVLLPLGALLFLLLEWQGVLAPLGGGEGLLVSLFQSVTTRTAGFNTVDIGACASPTLLVVIALMLIGGAPGSTAGGIKTTTLVVALRTLLAGARQEQRVTLMDREIPAEAARRSLGILVAALFLLAGGAILLALSESHGSGAGEECTPFLPLLFEAASALGTVGLSTGVTPDLSGLGKLVIMVLMFAGRLGPVTLATFAVGPRRGPAIGYPEEQVMLG